MKKNKRKDLDIVHIHPQSFGSDSGYLYKIYKALDNKYSQLIISNYYNTIEDANINKLFFKKTSFGRPQNKKVHFRMIIMVFEMITGYFKCIKVMKKYNPRIINFSLTSSRFVPFFMFLIRINFPKAKIIITSHDVSKKKVDFLRSLFQIPYKRIYRKCDAILVHNNPSKDIIVKQYGIGADKIYCHQFPMKNMSSITSNREQHNQICFSLVGFLCYYKGVDLLIDAWLKYFKNREDVKLVIAGNNSMSFDEEKINVLKSLSNVEIKFGFLSNEDYQNYLRNTDYLVLPYRTCGNSGVLYDALFYDVIPLVSNIDTLVNNQFAITDCVFESENFDSLGKILQKLADEGIEKVKYYKEIITNKRIEFDNMFNNDVINTYDQIFKNLYKEEHLDE